MNLQILLNKGTHHRCFLEKAGDFINIPGRFLFLKEKINVEFSNNNPILKSKKVEQFAIFESEIAYVAYILYFAISILAIPLTGAGLLLKKIAIETNERSKAYQIVVNDLFELKKLEDNKQELRKKIGQLNNQKKEISKPLKRRWSLSSVSEKNFKIRERKIKDIKISWNESSDLKQTKKELEGVSLKITLIKHELLENSKTAWK